MSKDYTKKQHFIPRFLLANFTNKDGYIYCLDKQTGKIFPAKPENIAYENHLYSVGEGENKDDILERIFSKIESDAAPILKRILETKHWPETKREREIIQYFLAHFVLRPSSIVAALSDKDKLLEAAKKEIQNSSEKLIQNDPANAMAYIQELVALKGGFYTKGSKSLIDGEYTNIATRFNIAILFSFVDKFIISSEYKYYTIYTDHAASQDVRAFMHFPIASNACIILSDRTLSERDKLKSWGVYIAKSAWVAEFNANIASKNERYLYAEDRESLIKAARRASFLKEHKRLYNHAKKKLLDELRSSVGPLCL